MAVDQNEQLVWALLLLQHSRNAWNNLQLPLSRAEIDCEVLLQQLGTGRHIEIEAPLWVVVQWRSDTQVGKNGVFDVLRVVSRVDSVP